MAHIYIGKKYILTVENDRFTIECEGEEICSLIPETAVGTVTETISVSDISRLGLFAVLPFTVT